MEPLYRNPEFDLPSCLGSSHTKEGCPGAYRTTLRTSFLATGEPWVQVVTASGFSQGGWSWSVILGLGEAALIDPLIPQKMSLGTVESALEKREKVLI